MTDGINHPAEELLTVDYVARHLNVSDEQVRRLIRAGKMRAVMVGPRGTRIPRPSYESYRQQLGLDTQAT